jgi:hypothetical protein
MATTTNYSWSTPDDTALVKDGAAAIRSLGTAIDTTVFTNAGAAIAKATVDAKGDLIAGTADNTIARLAVGANDTVLTADSSTATGLKWASAAAGGMTLISTTSLTGATVSLTSFSGYTDLQLIVIGAYGSNQNTFQARFNSDTGSNYFTGQFAIGANMSANSAIVLGDGLSSSSTDATIRNFSVLTIQRYASATHGKPFQVLGGYIYWSNTANNYTSAYNAIYHSTTAITSIDLFMASGNFSGGTAYLYGVK